MAEYRIENGIKTLEKYTGEIVEVFVNGDSPVHCYLKGRLGTVGRKYSVRTDNGQIDFKFSDVKWIQESLSSMFYYYEGGERKKFEGKSINIFLSYSMEKAVDLYQKIMREE